MTQKRFYEIDSQILGLKTIQDKNKRYTFPPLKTEKNHMFLKALNELSTDCSQLKKENAELKVKVDFYKDFQKDERELDKENEELKQKIISLEDARYSYKQDWKQASADCELYKEGIDSLKDENKGLIEENGQLKQSEDNLYTFFIQWFEEERGIYQEEFCEWWNAIQKGKTKFNEWEDDDDC